MHHTRVFVLKNQGLEEKKTQKKTFQNESWLDNKDSQIRSNS